MNALQEGAERIARLNAALPKLGSADRKFARSLATQFERKQKLSFKQWQWVDKLTERASNPKPEPKRVNVGDVRGVYALFQKAREHVKFPKIRLRTADGEPVCLSMSGPRSKHPNVVNITDGKPFRENKWYGRIEVTGEWTQPRNGVPSPVHYTLVRLADDPARVAAEHGKLTGNCCFCNRQLTDKRSVDVGYGPICADRFGLPWGIGK